jgi:hypothetical protein
MPTAHSLRPCTWEHALRAVEPARPPVLRARRPLHNLDPVAGGEREIAVRLRDEIVQRDDVLHRGRRRRLGLERRRRRRCALRRRRRREPRARATRSVWRRRGGGRGGRAAPERRAWRRRRRLLLEGRRSRRRAAHAWARTAGRAGRGRRAADERARGRRCKGAVRLHELLCFRRTRQPCIGAARRSTHASRGCGW